MNDNGIDGYRTYLARRDGEADLLNRRLSSREEFFAALEADSVRSAHRVDRQVFARNLRRRRPESGVDRQLLFLLATAKLNQAERFGVGLGETYGRNSDENLPPENVYLELEEHYHTRLLAYALEVFDLTFQVVPPPFVMRQFVKTGVFLPQRLGFMFVEISQMQRLIILLGHPTYSLSVVLFSTTSVIAVPSCIIIGAASLRSSTESSLSLTMRMTMLLIIESFSHFATFASASQLGFHAPIAGRSRPR